MTGVDPSVPIPLYYQLKQLIQNKIEGGDLKPGDQVATEAELCQQYGISRTPVRQALLELVNEGMLIRKAGRGTFVAPAKEGKTVLHITVPDVRWQWPLEEAARLWNRDHPETGLELDFSVVPLYDLHDQLATAVGHGQAPDISVLDSVWVAEFAHRRYLYALDDLDSEWVRDVKKGLYSSLLATYSYDDKLYAVPTNADTTVLWYRRDWLSDEGISPPESWDDLLNIGQHFSSPDIRDRYGIGSHPLTFVAGQSGGETTTYQLLPFLWTTSGDMITQGKVVIDSEANRRALHFLKNLVHSENIASPDVVHHKWDGALRAFARGEVVMSLGGTYENFPIRSTAEWDMATFLERTGFVPLPAGPAGVTATLVGGMSYGVYRQSPHPKESLTLLRQMLIPDILKPFSLQTGHNTAHKAVAEAISPNEDGFLGRTSFLFDQARSRPSLPTYNQVSLQFQRMVEACLTDQLSIEATLGRTAERISGITGLPVA